MVRVSGGGVSEARVRLMPERSAASEASDEAGATAVRTPWRQRPTPGVAVLSGIALLVGVVLRLVAPSPLWLDEAQTVAIARLPLPQLFDALRQDGAPPLYYLLLHGWMAVAGTSDLAVRAPSVVASLAALPLVAVLTSRLAGRSAVLPVVALTGLSPFAVRFATEARMYALVVLLTAVGGLLLVRVLGPAGAGDPGRRSSWRAVAGLAGTAAALLYTHYWALPLLAVLGAGLAWAAVRGTADVRPGARRGVLALAVAGLLFVPQVPTLLFQTARTAAPWGEPAGADDVLGTAAELAGTRLDVAATFGVGLLLLAGLGAVGVRRGRDLVVAPRAAEGRALTGLLAAAVLLLGVGLAALGGAPVAVRYGAVVLVPVLVCAAAGVALLRPRTGAVVLVLVLVAGAASSAAEAFGLRTQAGEVATALERRAAPGDVVVTCPDQLGPGLARALDQRDVTGLDPLTFPTAEALDRVDWVDYAERREDASAALFAAALDARAGEGAVWLVASPGYRVYDGLCGDLGDALELLRPIPQRTVRLRSSAFEEAGLTRYDARGVGVA